MPTVDVKAPHAVAEFAEYDLGGEEFASYEHPTLQRALDELPIPAVFSSMSIPPGRDHA